MGKEEMKFTGILALFFAINGFVAKAQHSYVTSGDIFGTRVFIENKGQFVHSIKGPEKIFFGLDNGFEKIFFTSNGLVYKFMKNAILDEEEREKLEKGKRKVKDESYFVEMNWVGRNENIEIIEEQRTSSYFTYGSADLNAYGYKKITYKNVYDGIDIEYKIPSDKKSGIKYNLVLHPGSDPSKIHIRYSGNINRIFKDSGHVIIQTPFESIIEHAPETFDDNGNKIVSGFVIKNNSIHLYLQGVDQIHSTIIVDPWVSTINNLSTTNYGYNVDYDYSGNLYVYGGLISPKVAKYDANGNLLWTFMGVVPGIWDSQGGPPGYNLGNFVVNKNNGKTYIAQGYNQNGSQVIRLTSAGNYDNFISIVNPGFREIWQMGFYCGSSSVYGLGGGTASNNSGILIDTLNGNVSLNTFVPNGPSSMQDVSAAVVDDQGRIFVYYSSGGPGFALNNQMAKVNLTFNGNDWLMPSTYSTNWYGLNKNLYPGNVSTFSQGYNSMAANNNYLFYYDGLNLASYDKNTGVKISSTTIPGVTARTVGGIAVDDCNNLYLGGTGNILCFNYNGNAFTQLPSISVGQNTTSVVDVRLNKTNNSVYASGRNFVGMFPAIVCQSSVSVAYSCSGYTSANVVATLSTNLVNPLLNYIWLQGVNTITTTLNTNALSNQVNNLANGIYTVLIQVNQPCGPVVGSTVNVDCCPQQVVTSTVTQISCSNTLAAASIFISGPAPQSIIWNPQPQTLSNNSLTAIGLSQGITSITINSGLGCIKTVTLNVLPPPPSVTFSVANLSGTYSITCNNPSVTFQALSSYTSGTLNYLWNGPSFSSANSSATVSQPMNLTVTATDSVTGCYSQSILSVYVNTLVPVISVAPLNQVITCSATAVSFTGTVNSPSVNLQNNWYSPANPLPGGAPVAGSNNSICVLSGNYAPGIYTLQTTDLDNGCVSSRTVQVTASAGLFPAFSLNCPTNFSIGCSPLNQTTISIVNPISTQTPQATCSFTFLPPGFSGVISPTVLLGNNTSTVTQIPGTWTLIVQDNGNFCRSQIPVPIIQNTIAPTLSVTLLTQTLTCYHSTLLATGNSTVPGTNVEWLLPVNPSLVSSPTIVIGVPGNGPNTSTSSLNYASYTVVATNTVNACQSFSVLNIKQNFKPPVSDPVISAGTPTAIYCIASTSPCVLTTGNSTTTSGDQLSFVINPCWQGPSPQIPDCGASSYSCYVPGIYSLAVMDNYNGCTSTNTINIIDRTQLPVLANNYVNTSLDCGSNQAALLISVLGQSTGIRYWCFDYPTGAAFSPTDAPIPDGANVFMSGTSSPSINISSPGAYQLMVTNTLTGCRTTAEFEVTPGGLNADFSADNYYGFAPLQVVFTPTNSNNLSGINQLWDFGNGSTQSNSLNINVSALYNSAGIYTVTLLAQKGSCIDTVSKIIRIELPSKLETPNVFTPNGDGSNDVFFFHTTAIAEISMIIIDRWGNKVYEVNSSTGNIAWDGKNLQGKECADGTYFYIVKAKGKDDKDYQKKGNISLYR